MAKFKDNDGDVIKARVRGSLLRLQRISEGDGNETVLVNAEDAEKLVKIIRKAVKKARKEGGA